MGEAVASATGAWGYGYIIQDARGKLIGFKYGFINWETNNMAEVEDLMQGLEMVINNSWTPLIIEGDSQVLILLSRKLQNGSHIAELVQSWRLEGLLERFRGVLNGGLDSTFVHV